MATPGSTTEAEGRILGAGRRPAGRFKLAEVEGYANALVAYLRGIPGVRRVGVAGSYRRCEETVGDLDVVMTAGPGCDAVGCFIAYDGAAAVVSRGPARAIVVLRQGVQVDARVVEDACYGAAMRYFTGSRAHNAAIRRLGLERGLKIDERGVFRGEEQIAGDTEESVFESVGLPFIPPELREDRGEIEAARAGRLPALITAGDLRGDLHAHTRATGGQSTIREMAEAALELGYEYLAITDRSASVAETRGLDADQLLRQGDEIDRLNAELEGFAILKGIEVDILEDGRLALPDEVLGRLDLVVGAVHSAFGLPRAAQTARLLRAMDRPHFSILAHPTGRLIQAREPCDIDMEQVIRHARERGCSLELNAHPDRLDLDDVHARRARELGVLVAIDSDARGAMDLAGVHFGIGQARRGWLEEKDVLNARPLDELLALLRRTV